MLRISTYCLSNILQVFPPFGYIFKFSLLSLTYKIKKKPCIWSGLSILSFMVLILDIVSVRSRVVCVFFLF